MRKKNVWIGRLFYSLMAISLWQFHAFSQQDSAKKSRFLVLPALSRSVETSWAAGGVASYTFRLSPADTVSRTSSFQAGVLYSLKKQLVTAIKGSQYFHQEKYILQEQLSYSSFPDKFWGLGQNTPDSKEEPYKFRQYYLYIHGMRKIAPRLFAGVVFEHQKVWDISYTPGGAFDVQDVKGRYGYKVSGIGASLSYDSRNNAFSPDKGFYGQFFVNHFGKHLGSDFTYTNIVLDLRKYIAVREGQVLAFQFFSFNNTGNEVPIRSLAAFGGDNRMRGYYEGRFKDRNQMLLQGEYRLHVYKRFGMVLFGGTGNVAHSISDYSIKGLQYSVGGGVRFALDPKEKLNLRVDYGIGKGNNSGLYLQIAEAF